MTNLLRHIPWHPLPLSSPLRSAPPLLIQSTFTSTSYTIYLTDLTSIWSETLSKREILARSEKEGTSIDPSEDISQLKILLEKLQHAVLKPDDAVDVELTSSKTPKDRAAVLHLKITSVLQTPLRPLCWTFCLSPLPRVQFTNFLVLPLLGMVFTLQDQTDSLLQTIKEKDMLIERLTDQLKEHGLDVKTMLGGGRARRRGLEQFDENGWRDEYGMEGERRVGEIIKEVFGGGMKEVGGGVRGLGEVDGWWKSVEDDDSDNEQEEEEVIPVRKTVGKKVKGKTPTKSKKEEGGSEDEGDEFEVQKTPPRNPIQLSPKRVPSPLAPPVTPAPKYDHPASDSDYLDLPPPRKFTPGGSVFPRSTSNTVSPPPTSRRTGAEPGKIGRKKAGKLTSSSPPRTSALNANIGEETEDSDTVVVPRTLDKGKRKESVARFTLDTGAISPPPPPKSNGGIKMIIGGKKNSPVPPIQPVENTDSEEESSKAEAVKPMPAKKTIGRIGKIGVKKAAKSEGNDDAEMKDAAKFESPGPSTLTPRKPPPPPPPSPPVEVKTPPPEPEDEDEKADRKRRQLEKELEAKKKAPVKKKRKF